MSLAELASLLRDILHYRAEKLVYVTADPGTSWGDILEVIDGVWPEVDVVSLITPQIKTLTEKSYCGLAPSCGQCTALKSLRAQPALQMK
jgi:hypothetical protein